MGPVVADTHSAIWYAMDDARLSESAAQALDYANANGHPILLPAICLIEMTYLVEKKRIQPEARERIVEFLFEQNHSLELAPLDFEVARAAERISRQAIPELPDRVIAATAVAYDLPLVTSDLMIRASGVPTIW